MNDWELGVRQDLIDLCGRVESAMTYDLKLLSEFLKEDMLGPGALLAIERQLNIMEQARLTILHLKGGLR